MGVSVDDVPDDSIGFMYAYEGTDFTVMMMLLPEGVVVPNHDHPEVIDPALPPPFLWLVAPCLYAPCLHASAHTKHKAVDDSGTGLVPLILVNSLLDPWTPTSPIYPPDDCVQ
jgi:hypothetical protein